MKAFVVVCIWILAVLPTQAQENNLSGIELSIDQDNIADFRRDKPYADNNNTISLRLGFYGAAANHTYLGLPWVRQKIDGFLVDKILDKRRFIEDRKSHNFVFVANGFSPSFISDETEAFAESTALGYNLAEDKPFSSFTGFRSTRRLEGSKRLVHSAYVIDMGINTSFTFGFASFGLAQSLDNLLGRRADANLWDRDTAKPYPTGQVIPKMLPMFMYSISAEAVVLKPLRKIVLQVRPELNLGYYTNIGLGIDFGKVMNVEKLVDNLSYTDTNNPSLLKVNNDNLSFSIVAGGTVRAVLYNAHLNGLYGRSAGHYIPFSDTRKLVLEGYAGVKVQLLKKIEIAFSINQRTSEFRNGVSRNPLWGTLGLKYLIADEGEGCYD